MTEGGVKKEKNFADQTFHLFKDCSTTMASMNWNQTTSLIGPLFPNISLRSEK